MRIRIPESLAQALRRQSKAWNVPVTRLAEMAVRRFVAQAEEAARRESRRPGSSPSIAGVEWIPDAGLTVTFVDQRLVRIESVEAREWFGVISTVDLDTGGGFVTVHRPGSEALVLSADFLRGLTDPVLRLAVDLDMAGLEHAPRHGP